MTMISCNHLIVLHKKCSIVAGLESGLKNSAVSKPFLVAAVVFVFVGTAISSMDDGVMLHRSMSSQIQTLNGEQATEILSSSHSQ